MKDKGITLEQLQKVIRLLNACPKPEKLQFVISKEQYLDLRMSMGFSRKNAEKDWAWILENCEVTPIGPDPDDSPSPVP